MIVSRLAKIPNTHKMIKNVAEIASSVTPNGGAKVLKKRRDTIKGRSPYLLA